MVRTMPVKKLVRAFIGVFIFLSVSIWLFILVSGVSLTILGEKFSIRMASKVGDFFGTAVGFCYDLCSRLWGTVEAVIVILVLFVPLCIALIRSSYNAVPSIKKKISSLTTGANIA